MLEDMCALVQSHGARPASGAGGGGAQLPECVLGARRALEVHATTAAAVAAEAEALTHQLE